MPQQKSRGNLSPVFSAPPRMRACNLPGMRSWAASGKGSPLNRSTRSRCCWVNQLDTFSFPDDLLMLAELYCLCGVVLERALALESAKSDI